MHMAVLLRAHARSRGRVIVSVSLSMHVVSAMKALLKAQFRIQASESTREAEKSCVKVDNIIILKFNDRYNGQKAQQS